jgi:hypothetical protein
LRPGEYHFKEDSMKRSLIFGLIAVLSAGILFVGCSQATDSTETREDIPVAGGVVIDHTANTAAGLKGDLMDTSKPEWQVIAFDISAGGVTGFDPSTTIPAGKTVVLVNSGINPKTIPVGTGGLIIEGKLIVSNHTGVSATNGATTTNKIFVGGTGSVEVQTGGELAIDDRKSVSNYVVNSTAVDSVLTKRVTFAGGSSLSITTELLSIADISALLGYINAGITLSVSRAVGVSTDPSNLTLEAPQNIMPSEIIQISGMNADRFLIITPAATETAASITIPAGAAVTINQALPTVKTLDVAGWVSAPSVGGTTEAVKVTVSSGGALQVTAEINFAAGSTIATGGEFIGLPTATSASQITMAPGSKINGTEVKKDETGLVPVISDAGLASLEGGKTYQIVGNVTRNGTINVPLDATLLIPANASLTVSGAISGQGKIVVEAGGWATGMPVFSIDKIGEANANPDLDEVTISSTKYLSTPGRIDIKLNGTVTGGIPAGNITENLWSAGGDDKPTTGNWSWVVIDNLLPTPVAGEMAIKQTNDSFHYYAGMEGHVSENPIATGGAAAQPFIYIPTDTSSPYKWKKYTIAEDLSGQPADTATNGFGVLLWSAAQSKTAKIEITPNSGTAYTVNVDWSGLRITPAPAAE